MKAYTSEAVPFFQSVSTEQFPLAENFGRVSTAREDFFGLLRNSLLNFLSRGLH